MNPHYAQLTIDLLGPMQVRVRGRPASQLTSDKVRALLAYLVSHPGEPQRRERLAGLLWPESSESAARASLRNALSVLRRAIEDHASETELLTVSRHAIVFQPSPLCQTDSAFFEQATLVSSADGLATDMEVDSLAAALASYRGAFMEGFTLADCAEFEEWLTIQRERFRRMAVEGYGRLATICEQRGESEKALAALRRQVTLEPWLEEGHRRLMTLLAGNGRRSEALAQFNECRQVLTAELGVEPDEETLALQRRIRDEAGLPQRQQATVAPLPMPLTPLVGRTTEMTELAHILVNSNVRLVTILGPGGMGKSRLALAIADRLKADGEHDVCFVEMAALETAEQLPSAAIAALGLPQAASLAPMQQLMDYLRNRELLLVLDNFEHLLKAAAMVVKLLEVAPGVTALVTSRARLNVRGEQLYPLGGLSLPASDDDKQAVEANDAVRLFVQQARHQRPDYQLTDEHLPAVIRICRLVEGMPLAILLAAGWTELFSPEQIAARIAASLDFLESDLQDLPERQRSLRAVFASTWALLTPAERQVYPRLARFRGGWTAAAAEAVAALSMPDLRRLLDKSLVQRVGQNRFTVHELLRQYAAESLAEHPADEAQTRERHARFYADLLDRATPRLQGADHLSTLAQIRWEQENARIAWHWAAEHHRIDLLAKSVDGLCLFYHLRGLTADGMAACALAIDTLANLPATDASLAAPLELTARLLLWQGIFLRERGDAHAETIWERAFAVIDSPALVTRDNRRLRADLLFNQGIAAVRLCDYDRAHALYSAGEALYRALELPRELANLLLEKAIVLWHKTRYDDGDVLNLEAMRIFQELDDSGGISESLMGLGLCANGKGEYEAAECYFRRCVKLAEETSGDRMYVAKARNLLGWTLHSTGKFDEALSLCRSSMATAMELGNRYWTSMFQWMAGTAQLHLGDYAGADQLLNDTLALAQAVNFARGTAAAQMLLSSAALAMEQRDRALTLAEESVATARTVDRPDELARALAAAAVAHLARGHADAARPYLYEALQLAHTTGANHAMVELLPASILYLLCMNDPSGAWAYRTLAFEQPLWRASRWFVDVVGLQLEATSTELPEKERISAEERARQCTLPQAIADLLARMSAQPG